MKYLPKNSWSMIRRSGLFSMALMVLVVFSFRSSIADWNDVPSSSMNPTILTGDRIVVNKMAYDLRIPFTRTRLATWSGPLRGDIVTCWSPADGILLVKRVVGTPGDVLEMQGGRLLINDQLLEYQSADSANLIQTKGQPHKGRIFLTENLTGLEHLVAYKSSGGSIRSFGPIEIPDGQYFMMGDNRDNSADSRYFGFVDRKLIAGKATGIAFSLDHDNYYLPRGSRICTSLY